LASFVPLRCLFIVGRLAFQAQIVEAITDKDYVKNILPKLKVYKYKTREGTVERVG